MHRNTADDKSNSSIRPHHEEREAGKKDFIFPNLNDLSFINHLEGGSGGVDVFQDKSGRKFVIKNSTSAEHLKHEILANSFYARLGFKIPSFAVYKDIPIELQKKLRMEPSAECLFTVAEFIEGEKLSAEHVPDSFKEGFVTDAFLKNRDLAGNLSNLITTGEGVYRVDNGSILSYRALGQEETAEDNIDYVIDLVTLRDPNFSPNGAKLYSNLSEEQIQQQKNKLLSQSRLIVEIFRELNSKLKFAEPRKLYDLLAARFRSIVQDNFSLREFKEIEANALTKANPSQAAGIMTHARLRGVKEPSDLADSKAPVKQWKDFVLLGQRNGSHQGEWCTLGGTCDLIDATLADTASREVYEETSGHVSYPKKQMQYTPHIDLKLDGKITSYRMYIAHHQYVDAKTLTQKLEFAEGNEREYLQFAWISLESLINAIKNKTDEFEAEIYPSGKIKIKLYPDMFSLLSQPEALAKLEALKLQENLAIPPDSQTLMRDFTGHFVKQTKLNREIKASDPGKKKETDKEDKKSDFKTSDAQSTTKPLSLIHLEDIVGEEGSLEEKIDRFCAQHAINFSELFNTFAKELLNQLRDPNYKENISSIKKNAKEVVNDSKFEEMILRIVDNEAYSPEQKIENIRKEFNELFKPSDIYDLKFKSMVAATIRQEASYHERGFHSFYHAAPHYIGVAYDLFTAFYKLLNYVDVDTYAKLRLPEIPFRKLPTIDQFMEYFSKVRGENGIYDGDEKYQEMAISVNPFLLGSYSDPGSCSYFFFLTNSAFSRFNPFSTEGVVDSALENMGFTPNERKSMLINLQKIADNMEESGGRMYAIHAREDVLDKTFYPATCCGEIYETPDKTRSMREVANRVRKGDLSGDSLLHMEARYFLAPGVMDNDPEAIQVICQSRNPLSVEENTTYLNQIDTVATQMIARMVSDSRDSLVVNSKKSLVRDHAIVAESVLSLGKVDPAQLFQDILKKHEIKPLILFLKTWKDQAPSIIKQNKILMEAFKFPADRTLILEFFQALPSNCEDFLTHNLIKALIELCNSPMRSGSDSEKMIFLQTLITALPQDLHKKLASLLADNINLFFDREKKESGNFTSSSFFEFRKLLDSFNPEARSIVILHLDNIPQTNFIELCKIVTLEQQKILFKKHILIPLDFVITTAYGMDAFFIVNLLAEEKPDFLNFQFDNINDNYLNRIFGFFSGKPPLTKHENNDFDGFIKFVQHYILRNKGGEDEVSSEMLFRALINLLDQHYLQKIICDVQKLKVVSQIIPESYGAILKAKLGGEYCNALINSSTKSTLRVDATIFSKKDLANDDKHNLCQDPSRKKHDFF